MAEKKNEILELTEELVKFQSTNDNEEEIEACLEYIEDYFSGPEFSIKRHVHDGTPSLVVTYGENSDPGLMLHGHIDVIEASDEMFSPERRDGRLYGRGTSDMKAGVAVLMHLMKDMKAEKPDMGLMIVTDEELGGFNGARKLFKEYSPDFAVSAEPNNTEGYMHIITEQKGVLRLKLSTEGLSAHGSRPWNGENAVEKFMDKWREVKGLFSEHGAGENWTTTVNLGKIKGGESTNKVPEKCEAWLDIRTAEEYPNSEVIQDIKDIDGLSTEVISDEAMLKTDNDNVYVKALKKSADGFLEDCSITRKEPASDMRHASREGIPAVVFGPEGYNPHAPDEYTVIESLEDYHNIMKAFVSDKFSSNGGGQE